LYVAPPQFAMSPSERPHTSRLARLQARRGVPLTSLRHEVSNPDPTYRKLIALLDGRHTRQFLAEAIGDELRTTTAGSPDHKPPDAGGFVTLALNQLARAALLVE